MRVNSKSCLAAIIIIFGLLFLGNTHVATTAAAAESVIPPQEVRVTRQSSRSLRVQWKRVEGASGYVIYRKNPGKKRYRKVKTVTGGKSVRWTDKKLKEGKVYTYVVKSYQKVAGKKVYSKSSCWASARTDGQKDKKVNVGKVKLQKNLTLGIRMTAKSGAKLTPKKYKKGKGKKVISKNLRYRSSNPGIATVDKKGVVTAGVNTGSCYIYATAHNGLTAKMKVTVVDYAKPETFRYYDGKDKLINVLLNDYKNEMCEVASYFCKNRLKKNQTVHIAMKENGELDVEPKNLELGEIQQSLERVVMEFPAYVSIYVTEWYISFKISTEGSAVTREVNFYFDDDCMDLGNGIMESHWFYNMHRPV